MRKSLIYAVVLFLCGAVWMPALRGAQRVRTQNPLQTYNFTGTCSDCTGTGTGQLVLVGYTPGQNIQASNFVSLSYTSNLLTFTVTSANLNSISGQIPVTLPAAANVTIGQSNSFGAINNMLFTRAGGYWCAGLNCGLDTGASHTWSLVAPPPPPPPAPTTVNAAGAPAVSEEVEFALALGIAVLGAILLKRHQTRHSA